METMKSLEGKEIVIYTPGSKKLPTIIEFEQQALTAIAGINKVLETDEDFIEAKDNVKSCKFLEIKIANAKTAALQTMTEYFTQATIADKLTSKLSAIRLELDKLVKTEETRRKQEIVKAGFNKVAEAIKESPVKHGFFSGLEIFQAAIKGKRSLALMVEAVEETSYEELARLKILEETYVENMAIIAKHEQEHIGLCPDAKALALSATDYVETELTNRILKRKIAAQEKAEAEIKAKEERDAKAIAEDQQRILHGAYQELKKTQESFVVPPLPADPFTEWNPPPIERQYILSVHVKTAHPIANIDYTIRQITAVQDVFVKEVF